MRHSIKLTVWVQPTIANASLYREHNGRRDELCTIRRSKYDARGVDETSIGWASSSDKSLDRALAMRAALDIAIRVIPVFGSAAMTDTDMLSALQAELGVAGPEIEVVN